MDPITRAAKAFLAEAEAFWRAKPGRALPLVAGPSERSDVAKALRLGELAPENRRPLFLWEAPFSGPDAYFEGLTEAIARDYERLRCGVAGEGVSLPTLRAGEGARELGSAVERAAIAMEVAAERLGGRFDGILVALLPEPISDGARWRRSVRTLAGMRRSARVRLAVLAPRGGPLGDLLGEAGAPFHIDPGELGTYLKRLGARAGSGPPAAELRGLLLDAAERTGAGEHRAAAERYREALALCAAGRRVLEEAMVRLALGGACLAAGAADLAVRSYREAAELAQAEGAWALACHGWLGVGGAHLTRERYRPAAAAYRAAAEAATRAGAAPLQREALRMMDTCRSAGASGGA
jgi:tetratricopeptide (TPR) repeat protein